jgi:hypothetical protein
MGPASDILFLLFMFHKICFPSNNFLYLKFLSTTQEKNLNLHFCCQNNAFQLADHTIQYRRVRRDNAQMPTGLSTDTNFRRVSPCVTVPLN